MAKYKQKPLKNEEANMRRKTAGELIADLLNDYVTCCEKGGTADNLFVVKSERSPEYGYKLSLEYVDLFQAIQTWALTQSRKGSTKKYCKVRTASRVFNVSRSKIVKVFDECESFCFIKSIEGRPRKDGWIEFDGL